MRRGGQPPPRDLHRNYQRNLHAAMPREVSTGMRHHVPLDHFRPGASVDLYRATSTRPDVSRHQSQGDHFRSSREAYLLPEGYRGHSGFQHSPSCPHGGLAHHDPFRSFSGDMFRGLGEHGAYGGSELRAPHEIHHDHHHDNYRRHPSPQEMHGSRMEGYRTIAPPAGPALGHHHHHPHHHPHHSVPQPHLLRHSSNLDRHRLALDSQSILERHEYDSDDPLTTVPEFRHPHHPPEALRHHRSVPDMYATLQEEEEQQRQEQHTYGAGCRLRRQHSLSKETSLSGTSAASDPPPPPPTSRGRLVGLQRQHSLGQEIPRSYTHDLFHRGQDFRDMTRSHSNALDLARAGSAGVLGATSADIQRSRSNVQDIFRAEGESGGPNARELRHAHSTHELAHSHSPRSHSPRHVPAPDLYPEPPPRASSGGSSGPSPPIPGSRPPSDSGQVPPGDGFPRQHAVHCEMSRAARHNYYHLTLPHSHQHQPQPQLQHQQMHQQQQVQQQKQHQQQQQQDTRVSYLKGLKARGVAEHTFVGSADLGKHVFNM